MEIPNYRTRVAKFPEGSIARHVEEGRVRGLAKKPGRTFEPKGDKHKRQGKMMGTSISKEVQGTSREDLTRSEKIARLLGQKLGKEHLPFHYESIAVYTTSVNNVTRILNRVEGIESLRDSEIAHIIHEMFTFHVKKNQNKISHMTKLSFDLANNSERSSGRMRGLGETSEFKQHVHKMVTQTTDEFFQNCVQKLQEKVNQKENEKQLFEKVLEAPKPIAGHQGVSVLRRKDGSKSEKRFVMARFRQKQENDVDIETEEDPFEWKRSAEEFGVDHQLRMQYMNFSGNRFGCSNTRIMPKNGIQNNKYI